MGAYGEGWRRVRQACGAGVLALAMAGAGAAQASEPVFNLRIPLQPRKLAVIELARQTGVSVGFATDLQCPGLASANGRMTLSEALDRLLGGSRCRAVLLDARTVAIQAAAPASAPHSRPVPSRPAPSAPSAQLGELVVTATKRDTTLRTAPYALTAVTGKTLERQGVTGVAELSALAAGVTVTNLGPGRDKVLLRGLSDSPLTGHSQSVVGIYLDDLRLTYNAPDPDLKWVDVARVEVLRGPQGSLYGAGSIGGVLHVVTNAPDPSGRSGSLSVTGSQTQRGAASYAADGVVNQPLFDGTGAIRLVGWTESTGGYIDNRSTGQKNVDRTKRHGFRLTGSWRANSDLTLTASLIQQAINSRDAHYAQPGVGDLARATAAAEPHDNDFLAFDLALRWTPDWAEVSVNSAVLEHDVASRYDASLAPASLAPPSDRPRVFDDDNDIKGFVNEARIVSRGPSRLQWLGGVFATFGEQDLKSSLLGASGAVGYAEARRDRLFETALFGEVSYDLGRRFTLTAGGRLFSSKVTTSSVVSLNGARSPFKGRTGDAGFAPKLVASYRASQALTLYVQAAEGYRAGGFNTSGPPGQVFGDRPGKPEPLRRYIGDELWSYEAGFRFAPLGGDLLVRGAGFYADWRDIQSDMLLGSGLPFTANIGDGSTFGVEMETAYARGPLTFSANIVSQSPELNRPNPGFPARADAGLPGVPKISYGLSATYLRPLTSRWSLDLAGRYAYVGASRLTFDAQTAPDMGDYGDARLSATLRSPDLRVGLFVENLTDSRGDTFAYGNPFSLRQIPQATPQRPRTVGITIRRTF